MITRRARSYPRASEPDPDLGTPQPRLRDRRKRRSERVARQVVDARDDLVVEQVRYEHGHGPAVVLARPLQACVGAFFGLADLEVGADLAVTLQFGLRVAARLAAVRVLRGQVELARGAERPDIARAERR